MLNIIDIPIEFKTHMKVTYPTHQKSKMIEERAHQYFLSNRNYINSEYSYLPIYWTQYLIDCDYGKNINKLTDFIHSLNIKYPNEKFFTVIQYAGGSLTELNNCIFYSSGGFFNSPIGINSIYKPIPLLCDDYKIKKMKKKYLASFCGNIGTHPIRKNLYNSFHDKKDFLIRDSFRFFSSYFYYKTLSQSIFSICPRGYGPTSYRLYESMKMQTIPVYISDTFWLTDYQNFDWNEAIIKIGLDDIQELDIMLRKIPEKKISKMINYSKEKLKEYFTWEAVFNYIKSDITP